ncbi:hypothetical protein B0H14DRAFT_3493921 [Mycena olivaceomarginata]|nr:hypothetical protein B0H14DRAFT_3493921 [Mycena olivaceomarginata]
MNITRGNLKRCAVNCILAFFGLADLQPDQVHLSLHGGKASIGSAVPPRFHPLHSQGGALLEHIVCHANIDRFPARNLKKPTERELPDSMVALGATAVYAALVEYRMTGKRQNIPFTEDAYEDIYRNHMATLHDTRKNAHKAMHNLLHELFTEITEGNKVAHTAGG